jgi:hypothetical protein
MRTTNSATPASAFTPGRPGSNASSRRAPGPGEKAPALVNSAAGSTSRAATSRFARAPESAALRNRMTGGCRAGARDLGRERIGGLDGRTESATGRVGDDPAEESSSRAASRAIGADPGWSGPVATPAIRSCVVVVVGVGGRAARASRVKDPLPRAKPAVSTVRPPSSGQLGTRSRHWRGPSSEMPAGSRWSRRPEPEMPAGSGWSSGPESGITAAPGRSRAAGLVAARTDQSLALTTSWWSFASRTPRTVCGHRV